ncbi:hypothetical protein [Sphingomonas sp.]|uniref:hypothetical protein n=1 Tax=Sphingomonas sp. TaxID=28214 RepID=UPI002D195981|nr:hypothetical protein [Sphingomonas sp.]HTG38902.1 hypothetical protein [Sphingomonas sp.]
MPRLLRLLLVLIVAVVTLGVPAGMMLGSFATGGALHASAVAGYSLPDQGTNLRSAGSADAVQPAAVAYGQLDRYAAAGAWVD